MVRLNERRNGHFKSETLRLQALADPDSLAGMAERFFEWMGVSNYSEQTIESRRVRLGYFIAWCEERGLQTPSEITKPMIERYQRQLFHYRKRDGKPLSVRSQHSRLVPIRAYFKWLTRNNFIPSNPASEIDMPRLDHRLPRQVLTVSDVESILNLTDLADPLGVRDRSMLETLYSTGMRRMELVNLSIYDLDAERGTLMIRLGKGKKDRIVPIGERAILWIRKYLTEIRPSLVTLPDCGALFLTGQGEPFMPGSLTQLVRNYVNRSGCGKKGACHLFRHTMATLMLENGADIRYIQEMLGHARLSTTQIYTQVSIRKLKEIHTLTHPAGMEPSKAAEIFEELEAELEDELAEESETGDFC